MKFSSLWHILTLKRLVNLFVNRFLFLLSRTVKYPIISSYPVAITVEPSSVCNLQCPECPAGKRILKRETNFMKTDDYTSIIDELAPYIFYLTLYFQGEPFLHHRFFEMIRYAKKKKLYVVTSTNGHFLNKKNIEELCDSGLDEIIISLDGTDSETYRKYRINGDFDLVVNSIKNLVNYKRQTKTQSIKIIIQFLLLKSNEHQVNEIRRMASGLKVDELRFKTAQFYDYRKGNLLMPDKEQFSRYKKNRNGTCILKNKLRCYCLRLWQSAVITSDGEVVPCCFDKTGIFKMGNIRHLTFAEIWKNTDFNNFRKRVLKNRKSIEICRNCSEGTIVYSMRKQIM